MLWLHPLCLIVIVRKCYCIGTNSQLNIHNHDWIDKDTAIITRISDRDGRKMNLVASDEFRIPGRRFEKGQDSMFEAITKPDDTNDSLQFYNGSVEYVTTKNGHLVITTRAAPTQYEVFNDGSNPLQGGSTTVTKNYTSGMLPGDGQSSGLWPALWLMGNLARANFPESTLNMWPWSYSKCGEIQNIEQKQEINACSAVQKMFNMKPFVGRGSPEIDVLEAMGVHNMPGINHTIPAFMSNSLHISPGISENMPRDAKKQNENRDEITHWYRGLKVGRNSTMNHNYWGRVCGRSSDSTATYIEDSVSVDTKLPLSAFIGQHIYKIEWQPGPDGYLYWYFDDELIFGIEGESLHNKTGGIIPVEPMYLILNVALSHNWGMPEPCPVDVCSACWVCFDCMNPDCQCALPEGLQGCKSLPSEMKIDYIRLYQDKTDPLHTLGCSPPEYPTAEFIEAHRDRYQDWESYSPISSKKNKPFEADNFVEEIDNTAILILRLLLCGIIIVLLSATIIILILVIWKGIGDDVTQLIYSISRSPYDRIPEEATNPI